MLADTSREILEVILEAAFIIDEQESQPKHAGSILHNGMEANDDTLTPMRYKEVEDALLISSNDSGSEKILINGMPLRCVSESILMIPEMNKKCPSTRFSRNSQKLE